ncbi:TPA: beta strand repeat-containing protein, partial [Salmonella enterica]
DTGTSNVSTSGTNIFFPTANGAQISNASIINQLSNGTNVTILTSGTDVSGQWGNITLGADISKTSGGNASLTLNADGNINITNHNITSTAGTLDVSLLAGNTTGGSSVTLSGANISTGGGDFIINQANVSNLMSVNMTGSVLNAGTGNVAIVGCASNVSLSTNSPGISISGTEISGGNIVLDGSSYVQGILINNSTLAAVNNLTLNSSSVSSGSTAFNNSTATASDITITGGSNTGWGLSINSGNISATGAILICGTSAVSRGINLGAGLSGADIYINGVGGNGAVEGVYIANTAVTAIDTLNISGCSTTGISLSNASLTSDAGNISLTGTALNATGMAGISVYNTILNAASGDVLLSGINVNGASGAAINASLMTINAGNDVSIISTGSNGSNAVQISNSTVSTTGGVSVINIAGYSALNTTAGVNISNSTLNGYDALICGTSATSVQAVVVTCGSVLNLTNNLTLSGTNTNSSTGVAWTSSTGSANNISITGCSSLGAGVSLNSGCLTAASGMVLCGTSGGSLGLNIGAVLQTPQLTATGVSTCGTGLNIGSPVINVTGGNMSLTGTSTTGTGVNISTGNTSLIADALYLNGSSGGAYGYILNATRGGGITDASNIYLGSAGSTKNTVNILGDSLALNSTEIQLLMQKGADSLTMLNATGLNFTENGDWTEDFSAGRGGGWYLNGASVSVTGGNADLTGVSFSNGTITVDGSLNITNTNAPVLLTNESITTGGAVNVDAAGRIEVTGTCITSNGGVSLVSHSDNANGVNVTANSTITSGGDVVIDGGTAGVNISSSGISAHDIYINGVGRNSGGGQFNNQAIAIISSDLSALNNITVVGVTNYSSLIFYNEVVRVSGSKFTTGNLSVTGDAISTRGSNAGGSGVRLFGDNVFSLTGNGVINATTNGGLYALYETDSALYVRGNVSLKQGNLTINADGGQYSGGVRIQSSSVLNVSDGASLRINAYNNVTSSNASYGPGYNAIYSSAFSVADNNANARPLIVTGGGLFSLCATNDAGGYGALLGGVEVSCGSSVSVDAYSSNGTGLAIASATVSDTSCVSLSGSSTNGTGVQLGALPIGTATTSNISSSDSGSIVISGESANGSGVVIQGGTNITNASVEGASTNGSGVVMNTNGSINGSDVTGDSLSGSGITVTGNTTVTGGSSLAGTSVDGTGVAVQGNTAITGSNVSGTSTNGSGTVLNTNGTVNGSSLSGSSTNGSGVTLSGNLTDSTANITGTTVDGSGVTVTGTVSNSTLTGGASGNGSGVTVDGGGSVVNGALDGSSVNGSGVTLNTTGTLDGSAVTGDSLGGSGVTVSGNLTDSTANITGTTVDGSGVTVTGTVSNSTLTGGASGNGSGVTVDGNVTGGTV